MTDPIYKQSIEPHRVQAEIMDGFGIVAWSKLLERLQEGLPSSVSAKTHKPTLALPYQTTMETLTLYFT